MLALELRLLTGRYVATSFHDRGTAEWPPHPARVFAAMADALYAGDGDPEERRALEWLENQGAPAIHASEKATRDVSTVFVPVNDPSVIASVDKPLAAVEAALAAATEAKAALVTVTGEKERKARDKALIKADKALVKAREKLRDAAAKATATDPNPSKDGLKQARSLFPDTRAKQPRTFPSVTPEHDRVVLIWPNASADDALRGALDRVASRVVRVGHSSSLAAMRLLDDPPAPRYLPVDQEPEGASAAAVLSLRVPQRGQLAQLDTVFDRTRATDPRVLPCAHAWYATGVTRPARYAESVFGEAWVVLRIGPVSLDEERRDDGRRRLLSAAGPAVAGALRGLVMSGAGDDAPEVLTGHAAPSTPSESPHLALVPLPNVGNVHADGELLGVALVLPREASAADRRTLLRALGARAVVDGASYSWRLRLPGGAAITLQPTDEVLPHGLRAATWCRAAHTWLTATPIALDRNPGDLQSRDATKRARAIDEASESISLACERIGLPRPERVEILPHAPLPGATKARRFAPYPAGRDRPQRVLTHALVRFDAPVRGPVLLGAGRYVGLGLMRPAWESRDE